MTRRILLTFLWTSLSLLGSWGTAYAAACTSTGTGNWATIATWSCGHVPVAADTVTIATGNVVTLNSAAGTVTSLTVSGAVAINAGELQLLAGTAMSVGGAASNFITLSNSASSVFEMDGGTLTVSGGITSATTASGGTFTMTGGTITMATAATALLTTDTFVLGSATTFNMSGGTIILQLGNNSTNDINILSTSQNVTGGTVQIGNAASVAGNPYLITNTTPGALNLGNLVIYSANARNMQFGTTLNILNNVTIQTGSTMVDNGAFALNIGGNWSNSGTFTRGTGTVTFNGSTAQTIGGTVSTTFNNLTNADTGSTTLLINTPVAGNLSVTSGTLDLSTFTANRTAAGGTLTVANGAMLMIGGTNPFPTNYSTVTLGATSTVVYYGTNQSVTAMAAPGYGYLTLSGSGTKTPSASFIVRSDLNIAGGVTLASGATVETVHGNVINNGTETATTGSITLSGGAATHTLSGNGNFTNLILNDALGAALAGSPTVSGVLTLTSGLLTTGANTMAVTSSCVTSISGAGASSYVFGNLSLNYPTNAGTTTCTFPIGDATVYAPVALAMVNVSSTLANSTVTARTDPGDYPDTTAGISGINPNLDVNRYWTLTAGGSLVFATYNATFNFVAGDLDPGAATGSFIIGRKSGGVWSYPTVGTKTGTSTQATAMTQAGGFGVFVIGPLWTPSLSVLNTVAVISDPVNGTTNPKFIPGALAQYTIMVTNVGRPPDSNSAVVTDPVPANMSMCVSALCSNPPVVFLCSTSPPCGLTYNYASNVTYSNTAGGGAPFTYTPVPDANGYDAAVTGVRINPQGFMSTAGGANPNFSLFLTMKIN